MNYVIAVLFLIPGLINFIPIIGSVSSDQLSRLYQIENISTDVELLLRHRAFLFGIVGLLIMVSAFQPVIRTHATLAGLVSMVSFIVLVMMLNISNPSLVRIAWIDVFAIVCLSAGYLLHLRYT